MIESRADRTQVWDFMRSAPDPIDEITEDLKLATTVTESTATAVTFTVPDRTGDDVEDTIR